MFVKQETLKADGNELHNYIISKIQKNIHQHDVSFNDQFKVKEKLLLAFESFYIYIIF